MVVDAKRMRVLINGLKHNTSYNFTVTCQESTDGGPRHRVTARTAPFIALKKPKLDIYAKPENMLTMSFSPVDVKDVRWDGHVEHPNNTKNISKRFHVKMFVFRVPGTSTS